MSADRTVSSKSNRPSAPDDAFEAFEDHAAYAPGDLTRAQAITQGREASWVLGEEYRRIDLRAVRVYMRPVAGAEADEAFSGEFDTGWVEVRPEGLNAAQKAHLFPMWKIEPRRAALHV